MKVALDLVRDIDRDETGLIEIRLPLCNYFLYYRYIQWAHQFGMKIHLPIDTRYLSYCQEYCDYCYRKGMPLFIISNQFHLVLSNPIWLNAFFEKKCYFFFSDFDFIHLPWPFELTEFEQRNMRRMRWLRNYITRVIDENCK